MYRRGSLSLLALMIVVAATPLVAQGPAYLTGPSAGDPVAVARDWVGANLATLGLTRVRAIGMSSQAVADGYDNRLFLAMPEGRSGLFTLFP